MRTTESAPAAWRSAIPVADPVPAQGEQVEGLVRQLDRARGDRVQVVPHRRVEVGDVRLDAAVAERVEAPGAQDRVPVGGGDVVAGQGPRVRRHPPRAPDGGSDGGAPDGGPHDGAPEVPPTVGPTVDLAPSTGAPAAAASRRARAEAT